MEHIDRIERELTMLLRRGRSIHVSTSAGDLELERASYAILVLLEEGGPIRLGEIARLSGVDASTITRQVQVLERANLVHRERDRIDRRAALLGLTEEGRATLAEVMQRRRTWLSEALDGWPGPDRGRLADLLSRLNSAIEARLAAGETLSADADR